jgi:BirA family biotin operon repressor/biotin-[acetyl-CoA-carboxylase] ligase
MSIAKHLQCSPAMVSKTLQHIAASGIKLIKCRGKGYCWENPICWLNSDSILKNLTVNVDSRFFDLEVFDSIDSTNSFLLKDLGRRPGDNRISVVAAELQTHGRGRLGRTWHSGLGDSLTFSLRWRFERHVSELSGLSLVVGIAITRVLNTFSPTNVSLKWPNDILFHHRKLGGVLIELRGEIAGACYAVIGIGINFKLSENIRSAIEQEVTDLFTITGEHIDRNSVFGALLSELRDILIRFEKYGFTDFMKEWTSYHAFEGKEICLILPDSAVIEGIVEGVNDDGALVLITATGRNSYNAGDISLRMKLH